jgi:glutamate synthase domain-containing protein 3
MRIDAKEIYYRELNQMIREAIADGEEEFILDNVNGQRYIADGINEEVSIIINGVPGNDLAAFMNGPSIIVNDNAQDAVGNTMNSGKIVIHGHAGDVLGYGMRGGKMFIRSDVGYRVGIHMKSYRNQVPAVIAGGKAGDFFGEYMAGGILMLLGLDSAEGEPLAGDYLGTGMHGGVIYVRGEVEKHQLGAEVGDVDLEEEDHKLLKEYLGEFCRDFELDLKEVMSRKFTKLIPISSRPYGNLYAY